MTATPAQVTYINNLRDGWEKFAANLATQLEDEAAYRDAAAARWTKTQTPNRPTEPRKEKRSPFLPKPIILTDEEYAAALTAYEADLAAWETTVTQGAAAAGDAALTFAQEWLAAIRVDVATLDQESASRVIDTLKKSAPHV